MSAIRRAAALACAVLLAACGSTTVSPTPAPSGTPGAPAPTAAATAATAGFEMALPWPGTAADGSVLSHPWTGGPHAFYKGSLCLPGATPPPSPCAADVPVSIRSGIDFGTGGGSDWDVHAVGAGTLVYKGSFGTTGFGFGAVTQHGDLFVLYAHMDEASLSAAGVPEIGKPVDRATKLGTTSCTGMTPCVRHLHLELRSGLAYDAAAKTVTYGDNVSWDGRTIGGWTIKAGALNYNGTAAACGTTITADTAGPAIYDATTCGGATPAPTAAPAVSGTWLSPKDGAKLATSSLAMSAKVSPASPSVPVAKLAFTVAWGSTMKTACTAAKADAKGAWSCKADLEKLGAPLGKLVLSFDVTDSTGAVTKAPAGPRTVTFAAPPPAPTALRLDCDYGSFSDTGVLECMVSPIAFTLRWKDASTTEAGFHIYGRVSGYDFVCSPFDRRQVSLTAWKLLATVKAGQLSWHGLTFDAVVSKLYASRPGYFFLPDDLQLAVAAFNAGGESARTGPVNFIDPGRGVCGD